jgi:iron complex transport system substrate-binding protein
MMSVRGRISGVVLVCLLAAAIALPSTAVAASLRIASINMCTDQLLLALADPEQIAGLGPYARDPHMSWSATEALRYPQLSGEAEDLLMLAPTLVFAGRYGKSATRAILRAKGIAVEEFDAPRSIDDVKKQIRRVGALVGHPERADLMVGRIDQAVARTRTAAERWHDRVLAVARRGWVTGRDSLLSSLLATVGLSNAAGDLGLNRGGFVSLEAIVAARPDLLLVAEDNPRPDDQGKALLLHPAIERTYPPDRRLVISDQLTICGGPMLPAALDRLAESIERVHRADKADGAGPGPQ